MATNRSIYLFTPERPRGLSARAPEPAPREPLSYYAPTELPLLKLRKKRSARSECILYATKSQRVLCAFALYGLVSYPGSLTLTSSGRCKIRWLNLILEVVAAILAA